VSKAASNLTKQPIELNMLEYVTERYRALDIADDPVEIFDQATLLRSRIQRHRYWATVAIPTGIVFGLIGLSFLLGRPRPLSFDIASIIAITCIGISWKLLDFGFRSENRKRFRRTDTAAEPKFDMVDSEVFSRTFETLGTDDCQLVQLSSAGTSIGFTPVSRQPIGKYVVKNAMEDAWLPAEVLHWPTKFADHDLHGIAPTPVNLVICWREIPVTPEPPGGWKLYYLWNQESALVGRWFDRASGIYPDKPVERTKARIAIIMVCEHFEAASKRGMKPKSQTKLRDMLIERLESEASWRLATKDITPLQAQQLSRINLTGALKSIDPADPRSELKAKPESWFYQLLSGDNDTILPYVRAEAIKDRPGLPMFKDD
jgi:hypothetical protein